jgi:leucyl/phenylalanyl-tRNA--protein transferase
MVLFTDELKISRSLRKSLRAAARDADIALWVDHDFIGTMQSCGEPRPGQDGTWITGDMVRAYAGLHQRGLAHSVEVWDCDTLVGGLYGVSLGRMFFGESMFSHQRDASKIALVALVGLLRREQVPVIDCQQKTSHLASLGAREIGRSEFCAQVAQAVEAPLPDWSRYASRPINELLVMD